MLFLINKTGQATCKTVELLFKLHIMDGFHASTCAILKNYSIWNWKQCTATIRWISITWDYNPFSVSEIYCWFNNQVLKPIQQQQRMLTQTRNCRTNEKQNSKMYIGFLFCWVFLIVLFAMLINLSLQIVNSSNTFWKIYIGFLFCWFLNRFFFAILIHLSFQIANSTNSFWKILPVFSIPV